MNITDYTLSPAVSGTARTSGGEIPYRFTFETARFTGGAEITAFCYLKEDAAPGRPVLFATNGGPGHASESVAFYIYNYLFPYNKVGYGQTVALVYLVVCILISNLVTRALRKREIEL